MTEPRTCPSCNGVGTPFRTGDDRFWLHWVHTKKCVIGNVIAGPPPVDEFDYLHNGVNGRFEPGDYLNEPSRRPVGL